MEKNKSTSDTLDELLLDVVSRRSWNYVRKQEYHGAFVATKSSLLAFEALLVNAIGSDTPSDEMGKSVSVIYSGKPSELYTSVSDILELRNPSIGRITGICITVKSTNAVAFVWLDDVGVCSGHSVVFWIAANSDSIFGKTEAAVEAELANIRCWYSRGRDYFDRCGNAILRIPSIIPCLLFVVALVFVVLVTFADVFRYAQWRSTAEELIAKSDTFKSEISQDPNMAAQFDALRQMLATRKQSTLVAVLRRAGLLALAYLLGIGIARLGGYLFPRVVFEIGDGIKRHEQIIWLRRFVIGSIIFCGVLIPLLREAIMR